MESFAATMAQPGYGFFMTLLIGLIAGWIAERLTSSDHGLFTNMLVGVAGSFVGAKIAELLDVPVFGFWRTLTAAVAGAVVIIVIWNAARGRGCSILTGGNATHDPASNSGWFFEPTIIDDLAPADPAIQQEIFGPVLSVQVLEGEEEALAMANATEFGLVAGIYTSDIGKALRLARKIDAGQVTINDYWAGGIEVPFGGNRKSGFGREKGIEGIDAYVRTKAITIRH